MFTRGLAALKVYRKREVMHLALFGFSCGLPYMLLFSTLSFWLREAGIDRSTIGFFSWIMVVYGIKWLWAPLVDRIRLPLLGGMLGQRRSWIAIAQLCIIAGLMAVAMLPAGSSLFALCALGVALSSSTQDIAVDAYRIECAPQQEQGALAAAYMLGYRLAMILSGAGTLFLAAWFADHSSSYQAEAWSHAYLLMAAVMAISLINTLLAAEPAVAPASRDQDEQQAESWLAGHTKMPHWFQRLSAWSYSALLCPFIDFFQRYRWQALWLLLLISCYRISDIFMGVMANPFYVDLGYSKEQVASVAKVFGVFMTLLGTFIGGVLVTRFSCRPVLQLGAVMVVITNALFALLALAAPAAVECVIDCAVQTPPSMLWLTLVISADNVSAGIATAAFIAFLSALTNVAYSATQYALFSSLMVLLPKFLAGFSGVLVDHVGYVWFFLVAAGMGIPVMLLIELVKETLKNSDQSEQS